MDLVQAAMSSFITITIVLALGVGVAKVFQIANDLNEVTSILKDIRRNSEDLSPSRVSPLARAVQMADTGDGPAALLRSLSAEEYAAALRPEVVPPPVESQPKA